MTDGCNTNTTTMITANQLPAILIGGPPEAGKSILTHNLTRRLRHNDDILHFVFRANPDIEGDWFMEGELDTVRQLWIPERIQKRVWDHRGWSDEFRKMICQDLSFRRHLPLLVDLGGIPDSTGKDDCIFRACTHAILLLRNDTEEKKKISQTWRDLVKTHNLQLLAEIESQCSGALTPPTSRRPVITGTLNTCIERGEDLRGPVYQAIVDCIEQLFGSYPAAMLEKLHLDSAPAGPVPVHLPHLLEKFAPDTDRWSSDLLQPLLEEEVPAQTALAVYGRAPNWVYGALALHAGTQPFYQFDAMKSWVCMPTLRAGTAWQSKQEPLHIYPPETHDDYYLVLMHPAHNYLDYTQIDQLDFPELSPERGVVISGKLPLWLFTALARFYADRNARWIALNDGRSNQATVIYSKAEAHPISEIIPLPLPM